MGMDYGDGMETRRPGGFLGGSSRFGAKIVSEIFIFPNFDSRVILRQIVPSLLV